MNLFGLARVCQKVEGVSVSVSWHVTQSAAKEMVEAVCDKAGPMKDECDSMVDSYFPMVWKLLRSYVVSEHKGEKGEPKL